MLIRISRLALELNKEADVPPEVFGVNPVNVDAHPHGFEGRVKKTGVARPRVKKTEGPRAYGPRLSNPSP